SSAVSRIKRNSSLLLFGVVGLRPRDLKELPPTLERRFIAHPWPRKGIVAVQTGGLEVARAGTFGNRPMSALGQKRTSQWVRVMSALPPKADISATFASTVH